jgi:DNA-binding FadR family transcriptional regulator
MSGDGKAGVSNFKPVQTRRAFEEVAEQIRTQLTRGNLRSGDRLPSERDLAERFRLSRNTIREALRSLEMAGILEFRKGATGGAFVREGRGDAVVSSFGDLFRLGVFKPENLTEARLIIGVAVTRLACQRGTPEDFDALRANIAASEATIAGADTEQRVSINLEFHRLLARASKNLVLIILTDSLIEIQRQLLKIVTPTPNEPVIRSRRRLLGHLLARDEIKATQEMEEHLRMLQLHYLKEDARLRQPARAAPAKARRKPPAK